MRAQVHYCKFCDSETLCGRNVSSNIVYHTTNIDNVSCKTCLKLYEKKNYNVSIRKSMLRQMARISAVDISPSEIDLEKSCWENGLYDSRDLLDLYKREYNPRSKLTIDDILKESAKERFVDLSLNNMVGYMEKDYHTNNMKTNIPDTPELLHYSSEIDEEIKITIEKITPYCKYTSSGSHNVTGDIGCVTCKACLINLPLSLENITVNEFIDRQIAARAAFRTSPDQVSIHHHLHMNDYLNNTQINILVKNIGKAYGSPVFTVSDFENIFTFAHMTVGEFIDKIEYRIQEDKKLKQKKESERYIVYVNTQGYLLHPVRIEGDKIFNKEGYQILEETEQHCPNLKDKLSKLADFRGLNENESFVVMEINEVTEMIPEIEYKFRKNPEW